MATNTTTSRRSEFVVSFECCVDGVSCTDGRKSRESHTLEQSTSGSYMDSSKGLTILKVAV